MEVAGQRVIVTAGGSGIGRRLAERFQAAGAKVFVGDIDATALRDLPEGLGRQVCDIADPTSAEAFFAAALDWLGGLDSLLCTAGTAGPTATIEATDPAAWRACTDVNLFGLFLSLKYGLPALRAAGGGAVVAFSSTAGQHPYPLRSPYCAAKWGVIGLVKTAALEAGPDGVRVNALCPGAVEGARMDRVVAAEAAASGRSEEAVRASYVKTTAMKSWIDADELADTCLFLASPAARHISGQAIGVDSYTFSI